MSQRITAIVENGFLRPTAPLGLPDGTRLELSIENSTESWVDSRPSQAVKDAVAAIAAMPMEPGPEFSGRDHDKILYGEHGAR